MTNALASKNAPVYKRASARSSPAVTEMDSPRINQRNDKSTVKKTTNNSDSSILKKSTLSQEELEVPANVDEVAMINNIKEEKENYKDNNESLVSSIKSVLFTPTHTMA